MIIACSCPDDDRHAVLPNPSEPAPVPCRRDGVQSAAMSHQEIVGNAIASYKETVDESIRLAQTFTLEPILSIRFNTSHITDDRLGAALKQLRTGYKLEDKAKCAIYVFTLTGEFSSDRIFDTVSSVNQSRAASSKKKNLCAVNRKFAGSPTLYVGRSFAPRTRIAQHLNASDNGTYAMHLDQWAKPLGLELELQVYDVPEYEDTPNFERAMSVLETGLWDHLKPLLGRRGDK